MPGLVFGGGRSGAVGPSCASSARGLPRGSVTLPDPRPSRLASTAGIRPGP